MFSKGQLQTCNVTEALSLALNDELFRQSLLHMHPSLEGRGDKKINHQDPDSKQLNVDTYNTKL